MKPNKQIAFGAFRLDEMNECLWRDAQAIALRPKAYAVLKYLVARPGQLITKQQILDAVWPDTFVGDAVLKDCIRQLREALGDEAAAPQYIETAHRRGYRFIASVTGGATERGSDASAPDALSISSSLSASTPPVGVFGRETALAQMRNLLEEAVRGERQLVFITGEPGIGKTTLVETFLDQAAALQNIRIARGQCLEQYGAGEAYLPVLEAISRLCREPGRESVVDLLGRHAPTWLAQMPSLVGVAEREALRQQMLGATRERMLREMAEAIEALTAESPLIVVLEDLHWSDYSTLDLISYLARRREPARLMLIGTYRPVEVILNEHPLKSVKQDLRMCRQCVEIPLEYLTEEAVAEYLSLRFPGHRLSPDLAQLIHQRTEGNPLFMVNMMDYLLDENIIVERQGEWRLQVELAEVEMGVPENIRYLIEKQIERLSAEEQRVLEGASVVGLACSAVAIAAGLDAEIVRVEEICEELARRQQFLTPPRLVTLPDGQITPRFKFIHVLYLDALYKRIAVTRRAQIHSRIGECGEKVYGDRTWEIAAELAAHFEHGRDLNRAVKYLQLAAENAALRFATHEAVTLARRGLGLLRALPASPARDSHEHSLRMVLGTPIGGD
jgi:predicted ATPase/DNA-binding winged helix-turn-helix (wHTH) protein